MSSICEKLCDVNFTNPAIFSHLKLWIAVEDSIYGLLFKIVHNLDRQTSGFREKNTIAITSQNVHNSVSQHISS